MGARNDAILNGQLTYFSGKPCRRGHTSERYTSGGMCVQCVKASNQDRLRIRSEIQARQNMLRVEGAKIYQKLTYPKGFHLMDALAAVINTDRADLIEECAAFLSYMDARLK